MLQRFIFSSLPSPSKGETQKADQSEASASENVVIDWEGCLNMCKGNQALAQEMLAALVKEIERTRSELAKAYAAKDNKKLRAELHRCLGGVCYMRVPQLDYALKAFQSAVKAEVQDAEELERTYTALLEAITAFLRVASQ